MANPEDIRLLCEVWVIDPAADMVLVNFQEIVKSKEAIERKAIAKLIAADKGWEEDIDDMVIIVEEIGRYVKPKSEKPQKVIVVKE